MLNGFGGFVSRKGAKGAKAQRIFEVPLRLFFLFASLRETNSRIV
jgi:hypothetical protein